MSIKGLDTVEAVLLLIKEPEKFEAKLAEIKAATAKYQEVVEAVVALSQVNDYTVSIKNREIESKQILENSKKEVVDIREKAKKEASFIVKKATLKLDEVDKREQSVSNREKVLSEREIQISKLQDELTNKIRQYDIENQKLSEALHEIEERKSKLKAALNV